MEIVTLQDLAVSTSYEIAALVAVLEGKGVLIQEEVLEEVARMNKPRGQAR